MSISKVQHEAIAAKQHDDQLLQEKEAIATSIQEVVAQVQV